MASADLRAELNCSICLSLYTDPVSLRCGHNFCRFCIVSVLDAQAAAGAYSCPDCRAEYPQRPPVQKNRKLGNIVERFSSTQRDMEETRIFCTYCIKSPVPAVKSCVQCENSLCDDHLKAHNKMSDHTLTEPTGSFGNKKCSIHKKVLEYYCLDDAACLCVSCCLVGNHKGHLVELLDEASKKKKTELKKYLDELNQEEAELQTRVQNLHDHKINIQEKASEKRKNISKLFMDIKEQLEMAEAKALIEIYRQEDKIVSKISHLLKELEIKEKELSKKMRHMEKCHLTDPIRLLQESDVTVSSHGDDDEDTGGDGGTITSEGDLDEIADLDEDLISLKLHQSMRDIVTIITSQLVFQVPDILLDVDTAPTEMGISDDLKTAAMLKIGQSRRKAPGRFLAFNQVLSRCGLSSGRHYWEVKWNQVGRCGIGMSYPTIEKEGDESGIGENDKSWCLDIYDGKYVALYNSVSLPIKVKPTCPRFGVFLDYESGRLSFYELCNPIRLLHTFTASFTEPLHVAFYMDEGACVSVTC